MNFIGFLVKWYCPTKRILALRVDILPTRINTFILQMLALNLFSGVSGAFLIAVLKPMESSTGLLISVITISIILVLWSIITQHILSSTQQNQKSTQTFEQKLQYLSELTGILPDRVIILNNEGRYQAVLKSFTDPMSYQPENPQGQLFHEVLGKDLADYCLQMVQKTLAENTPQFIEYTFTHDDTLYYYEARLAPFTDPQSGKDFVIWVARDITKRKQSEQELIANEQRLRSITSALPDRTVILNAEGRYLDVLKLEFDTDVAQEILAERVSPLGKLLHDVYEKDFADFCLEKVHETIEKDTLQIFEYPFEQGGQTHHLEGRTIPYADVISGEKRVIWISRDITERKKNEQALIDSEKRLRSITNALPDRTVILDEDGWYHDVLKAAHDTRVSISEGVQVGKKLHDISEKNLADFCLAKIRETIKEGVLQIFEYTFEQEGKTYYLEGRTIPYTDIITGEKRVIWTSRDINERKKNEQALIDSERLLHTIIGVFPDRTLIFDVEGHYKEILKAEHHTHHPPPEIYQVQIDGSLHEFFSTEFAEYCLQMIRKAVESGKIHIFEYNSPIPNEDILFEGRTIPFNDPRTGEPRVLWVSRDVSSRKQVEQQRLELALEKEKLEFFRQFVDSMTHDLKTPLTVIDNSLYLVQRDKDGDKNQNRLELARNQIKILTRMIDDMLVMARFDSIPQLELQETDLLALLQNVVKQIHPKAEHKQQDLHFSPMSEPVIIQAASKELSRALTNLIDNAIKYTPDKGSVEILIYLDNSEVITEIRDTGIGISPTELPQIFDRFFRSKNGRSTATGTGLGLAITQRIIDLHEGNIVVESKIDQGSIFYVRLPIY